MSDYARWVVVPLVSMIVFAIAGTFSLSRGRSTAVPVALPAAGDRRRYIRVSITAVVIGHIAMIAWPTQLLSWIRDPMRLVALEVVLFTTGTVATIALAVMIRRRLRATSGWPIGDVVFLSVLGLTMTSGLGLAFFHRWAVAWSIPTLTPYMRSVLSLQPDVGQLDEMPYLVRLHVCSAFLALATLPFSTAFEVIRRAWSRVRFAATPVVSTMERRWALVQGRALERGRRLMWPEEDD
ncbi:MAG TPA: respiratory nitrate reductase subunit gamma [Vicinamibacterales bacterium]|nr:respiratory nitrate reductase subunit gamma [Vicinamibacterales bacterium]